MEEWRDVVGFEELYSVSNMGRVYSKKYKKILKTKIEPDGYEIVRFNLSKLHRRFVHVLVAQAFIGIPEGCQVHHKDCNKSNNKLDNLAVLTKEEHIRIHNEGKRVEKTCVVCGNKFTINKSRADHRTTCSEECKIKLMRSTQKGILQYTKEGEFVRRWNSIAEVHNTLNIERTGVCAVCNNRIPSYKGYVWMYEE